MATATNLQPGRLLQSAGRAPIMATPDSTELVVLSLNDQGVIRDCSMACQKVFGFPAVELIGCHVSTLLPQLQAAELVRDGRIDTRLAYLCHCGFPFQARHRNGHHFGIELFINRLDNHNVAVLVRGLNVLGTADLVGQAH